MNLHKANKKQNYILYLSFLFHALMIAPLSPLMAEIKKTLPEVNAGLIMSLYFVGFIIISLIVGVLSKIVNEKLIIEIGFLSYIFLLPIFATSTNSSTMYITIFLIGGCGGILECLGSALLVDTNLADKDYHINMGNLFFSVGAIFSPLFFSTLVQIGIGYSIYYFVATAIAIILLIVYKLTNFEILAHSEIELLPMKNAKILSFFKEGKFLLICIALLLYVGSEVAFWGWLSSIMQLQYSFSSIEAGIAVSLFWISLSVGRYICGKLLYIVAIQKMIIGLNLASAFFTFAFIFAKSLYAIYLLVILLGLSYSSMFPFLASYGARQTKLHSGMAFSMLIVFGNIGCAIIPYVFSIIESNTIGSAPNIFLGVMFLLIMTCSIPVIILEKINVVNNESV